MVAVCHCAVLYSVRAPALGQGITLVFHRRKSPFLFSQDSSYGLFLYKHYGPVKKISTS